MPHLTIFAFLKDCLNNFPFNAATQKKDVLVRLNILVSWGHENQLKDAEMHN